MHDININSHLRWFGIQQDYKYHRYASTFILELHHTERVGCLKDDCYHIKLFFNQHQMFNELGYCNPLTNECPYTAFKKANEAKFLPEFKQGLSNCYMKYDPNMVKGHIFQLV